MINGNNCRFDVIQYSAYSKEAKMPEPPDGRIVLNYHFALHDWRLVYTATLVTEAIVFSKLQYLYVGGNKLS